MTSTGSAGERLSQLLTGPPPPDLAGPELLPSRLARATATALAIDGAGLSLHDAEGLRTPLGASDEVTGDAERLQFTHGVGPCLRAHDDGTVIAFDEADLARNWPKLQAALTTRTPFRAVLSVPLLPPLGPTIVLDLWLRHPAALTALDRDQVEDVVVVLTRELVAVMRASLPDGGGTWWSGPDARRRTQVWQAMGQASVALGISADDALAVLKARAFAEDRLVDDVADDLVGGRLAPEALQPPG